MSNRLDFKQYLLESPLEDHFVFSKGLPMSFHWGDWPMSIQFQQQLFKNGSMKEGRTAKIGEIFNYLQQTPVWLNNRVETVKITLYELYQSYHNPNLKKIWLEDSPYHFLVSFQTSAGPYIPLHSMRWFHRDIYSYLVYNSLLSDELFKRNFRINMNAEIQIENEHLASGSVNIHQLAKQGMVLRIKGKSEFNHIATSELLIFKIGMKAFDSFAAVKNLEDLIKVDQNIDLKSELYHLPKDYYLPIKEVLNKYGNLKNCQTAKDHEYFIFVPWHDFIDVKGVDEIQNFVLKTEALFQSAFKRIA